MMGKRQLYEFLSVRRCGIWRKKMVMLYTVVWTRTRSVFFRPASSPRSRHLRHHSQIRRSRKMLNVVFACRSLSRMKFYALCHAFTDSIAAVSINGLRYQLFVVITSLGSSLIVIMLFNASVIVVSPPTQPTATILIMINIRPSPNHQSVLPICHWYVLTCHIY